MEWNPDELLRQLYQGDLIPNCAVCEWFRLGIELDISSDELKIIEKNVTTEDVVVSTRNMLEQWQRKSGKASELIKALESCELMAYAAMLKKELGGKDEFTEKYLLNVIAPAIATEWKPIGIQLDINNVYNYAQNVDLTGERFRQMLKLWLQNNKSKQLQTVFDTFYKALIEIELNKGAEEFKEKAKKKYGFPN